jgi:hypothetical protein
MKTLCTLFLSIVLGASAFASDVTGKWKMSANAPDGNVYKFDLIVKESGGKHSGSVVSEQGEIVLEKVALQDNVLTFTMPYDIGPIAFKLKLDGDHLKGDLTIPDGASGEVTGDRDKSSAGASEPSSAAGKWQIVGKDDGGGDHPAVLTLKQESGKWGGEIELAEGGNFPLADLKVSGNDVSFKIQMDGGDIQLKLAIAGKEVKGTYTMADGNKGSITGSKAN